MPDFQLSLSQKKILSFFAKSDFGQNFYWTGGNLAKNPKLNFQELTALVDKKFGITIEQTLLIAKINELAGNLALIQPFLFSPPKDIAKTVKNFFQEIFNSLAKQKIK